MPRTCRHIAKVAGRHYKRKHGGRYIGGLPEKAIPPRQSHDSRLAYQIDLSNPDFLGDFIRVLHPTSCAGGDPTTDIAPGAPVARAAGTSAPPPEEGLPTSSPLPRGGGDTAVDMLRGFAGPATMAAPGQRIHGVR